MTNDEKAKFLEGYLATKREAQQLKSLSAELAWQLAWLERLPQSEERKPERRIVRDLQARYARNIDARAKENELRERAIAGIPNDIQRNALELRCFGGLTWERIAEELGFSVPHTHRIRRAALAAVQL